MKHKFILQNFKPFSINAMYYKNNFGKTADYKDWSYKLFYALSSAENAIKFSELRTYFDSKKHYYEFSLWAVYPDSTLFNKQGQISAKTQDASNWEKSLIDCFMLPKYYVEDVPYGCKNLNTDDRTVAVLHSSKARSASGLQQGLIVEVEIKPLENLPVLSLD